MRDLRILLSALLFALAGVATASPPITLKVWTCSGTAGQYTPGLAGYSVPNCTPSSAGAWQTYTINQPDALDMANTEQLLYYGVAALVFGIGAVLFAFGYSAGNQR